MLSSQDKVVRKAHMVPVHGAYNLVGDNVLDAHLIHWV